MISFELCYQACDVITDGVYIGNWNYVDSFPLYSSVSHVSHCPQLWSSSVFWRLVPNASVPFSVNFRSVRVSQPHPRSLLNRSEETLSFPPCNILARATQKTLLIIALSSSIRTNKAGPKLYTSNQILTYKVTLKPIWTYWIQLWGTASTSDVEILYLF
jgi:hypothetical protein